MLLGTLLLYTPLKRTSSRHSPTSSNTIVEPRSPRLPSCFLRHRKTIERSMYFYAWVNVRDATIRARNSNPPGTHVLELRRLEDYSDAGSVCMCVAILSSGMILC